MISIIICTRKKNLSESFVLNIKNTVGIESEIILIDNSENLYSLSEAYNKGVKDSMYNYLCFVHDDVLFRTSQWGELITRHLNEQNVGIIGVAGREYLSRVPGAWPNRLASANIIQSDRTKNKKSKRRLLPKNFNDKRREVVMLDGVLLCMKKDLFKQIKFDEGIDGFHGYDFDISIQSCNANYKNYVIYDVLIEHFSRGNTNKQYYINLLKVFRKWENKLPIFAPTSNIIEKKTFNKIEYRGVIKLVNKLIKRRFSKAEIKDILEHYLSLIATFSSVFTAKILLTYCNIALLIYTTKKTLK